MKLSLILIVVGSAALAGAAPPETKSAAAAKLSALDLQRESLKQQRESLRQQIGVKVEASDSDYEFLTPMTPLPDTECPALEKANVESLIATAAKKQALSPELVRAVMRQESGFKPCAVSVKGAQGLMQLMPETAAQLHVTDPFDPEQNVQAGAAFLKQLLKKYNGDLRLALVAYNAGATRADQLDPAQYPLETQGYLANIFAELDNPATPPAEIAPAPQN
ncbi:MAG: lytic transglycosylase domain-containing protein [Acidobacteriota bacterium]|nr:lytic transglycosylase domain-containing protein [Acidobacteriota bacterium]